MSWGKNRSMETPWAMDAKQGCGREFHIGLNLSRAYTNIQVLTRMVYKQTTEVQRDLNLLICLTGSGSLSYYRSAVTVCYTSTVVCLIYEKGKIIILAWQDLI